MIRYGWVESEMARKSRNLGLALAVIAQLMVVLDTAIVNIGLPSIQRAVRFSPTGLERVVNGYALAFGGLLLLGSKAGEQATCPRVPQQTAIVVWSRAPSSEIWRSNRERRAAPSEKWTRSGATRCLRPT